MKNKPNLNYQNRKKYFSILVFIEIILAEEKSPARTVFPQPGMVVNCLSDGVQVDINIAEEDHLSGFNGIIYVKGHSKDENCRKTIRTGVDTGSIDFKVLFGQCGLVHIDVSNRAKLQLNRLSRLGKLES